MTTRPLPVLLDKEAHARATIERVAQRLYDQQFLEHRLTGRWRYGRMMPFDILLMFAADNYRKLEAQKIIEARSVDTEEQKRQADKRLAELNENREAEARIDLSGKKAKEFDGIYLDAKAKAKAKTPHLISTPGRKAIQTKIHK